MPAENYPRALPVLPPVAGDGKRRYLWYSEKNCSRRRRRSANLGKEAHTPVQQDSVYEIVVQDTQNRDWQGRIRFSATGEEQPFDSLLELLALMEQHLPGSPDGPHIS